MADLLAALQCKGTRKKLLSGGGPVGIEGWQVEY